MAEDEEYTEIPIQISSFVEITALLLTVVTKILSK